MPGADSIDATDSSTMPRNASDTAMAPALGTGEPTRWLMVSFSHNRDLLRDKGEETTSADQCQGKSDPNWTVILAIRAVDLFSDEGFSGLHGPSGRSHGAIVSCGTDKLRH